MNMFRRGRKAKDEEDASAPPPHAKTSRSLTRRKKKTEVEVKPVVDLNLALPDSNEFRTSLIMPNLSARFSMLREQDDPMSKIGKAADDSVLFPKRASRLNLFGHNPLTDIAEVESIRSSIRRPFAEKHGSTISDGYGSDDGGSIMGRSRPGEGNNLFGGRQKLYRVPNGSSRNLNGDSSAIVGGKHMYENDVSMSAFQQYRQQEREQKISDERPDRNSLLNMDTEDGEMVRSPSTSFSKNRGTQSSTNSGPSGRRTSTAATSVTSESPVARKGSNAAVTKVKEQDANSSAESIGFAASPSFRKVREDGTRPSYKLSQSKSAANLRENSSRPSPVFNSSAFRTISPPPSASSQPLDFGLKDTSKSPPPSSRFQTASPTLQLDSEQNDAITFNRSLQPNDRGKATAMGLFNKPQRNFDEQQYLQRQLQMHEGRSSPQIPNSRSTSRASPELQRYDRQSNASVGSFASPPPPERSYTAPIPPIPGQSPSPAMMNNPAMDSNTRERSRSKSSASGREAAVKARIESLIKRQNAELAAMEAEQLGPMRTMQEQHVENAIDKETNGGTFFDNSDGSDDDSQFERPSASSRAESNRLAPTDVHPAFRDFNFNTESSESSNNRQSNYSSTSRSRQSVEKSRASGSNFDADFNSSGQSAGLGLSGMIRTHLRQDSDRSSIFPPPSPALPLFQSQETRKGSVASTTRTVTESTKSDPFEYDSNRSHGMKAQFSESAQMPTMSDKAQQILGLASALRNANSGANETSSAVHESIHSGNMLDTTMQSKFELGSHHRNASTETQKEQQRFDDELAERRRRIQEGLRSVNDRSTSSERSGQGFGMPRFGGKFSGTDRNQDPQAKAMKMLGISNSASRTNGEPWRSDANQDKDVPARHIQRPATVQDDYHNGRHTPTFRRPPPPRPGQNDMYDRPPRSTTPSGRSSIRDRSNSGNGDRSMSRNKQYTDDSEPMPNRYNSPPNAMSPPHRDARRPVLTPEERTYDRSASAAAGSYRERPGYFNSKPVPPPEIPNDFTPRASPRPSAQSTAGAYESPINMPMSPPVSAAPSPNPPFSNAANGRATPTLPGRATPIGGRKKSVTKGMISEPTFLSSTSSVPLVHLPQSVEPMNAPPIPVMNPRRRGTTASDEASGLGSRSAPNSLPTMHESSRHGQSEASRGPPPKQRNRLRKSSSEGGNMAAKARQQALMADIARERERSPAVPVFPNRSATALGMSYEGGMF